MFDLVVLILGYYDAFGNYVPSIQEMYDISFKMPPSRAPILGGSVPSGSTILQRPPSEGGDVIVPPTTEPSKTFIDTTTGEVKEVGTGKIIQSKKILSTESFEYNPSYYYLEAGKPVSLQQSVEQLNRDVSSGRITQEQYETRNAFLQEQARKSIAFNPQAPRVTENTLNQAIQQKRIIPLSPLQRKAEQVIQEEKEKKSLAQTQYPQKISVGVSTQEVATQLSPGLYKLGNDTFTYEQISKMKESSLISAGQAVVTPEDILLFSPSIGTRFASGVLGLATTPLRYIAPKLVRVGEPILYGRGTVEDILFKPSASKVSQFTQLGRAEVPYVYKSFLGKEFTKNKVFDFVSKGTSITQEQPSIFQGVPEVLGGEFGLIERGINTGFIVRGMGTISTKEVLPLSIKERVLSFVPKKKVFGVEEYNVQRAFFSDTQASLSGGKVKVQPFKINERGVITNIEEVPIAKTKEYEVNAYRDIVKERESKSILISGERNYGGAGTIEGGLPYKFVGRKFDFALGETEPTTFNVTQKRLLPTKQPKGLIETFYSKQGTDVFTAMTKLETKEGITQTTRAQQQAIQKEIKSFLQEPKRTNDVYGLGNFMRPRGDAFSIRQRAVTGEGVIEEEYQVRGDVFRPDYSVRSFGKQEQFKVFENRYAAGVRPIEKIAVLDKYSLAPKMGASGRTRFAPITVEGIKTSNAVIERTKNILAPQLKSIPRTRFDAAIKVTPKFGILERTSTATKTKTLEKTLTTTRPLTRFPLKTKSPRIPPIIPTPNEEPIPQNEINKLVGGFRPFARLGGRNVFLSEKPLPFYKAIAVGKEFTGKEIARSFGLKQVGVTREKDIAPVNLSAYRYKKPTSKIRERVFIEKSKFAIDTQQEKEALRKGKKRKQLQPRYF